MPYILSYTKRDDIFSTLVDRPKNMSGHLYFSDIYEAMHLALSRDGRHFTPLRNNTGILFPKATFTEGKPEGTTKTLRDPWMFERADGSYGVCGVRRNEDGPDPLSIGCVMLFSSKDLICYEECGFFKVADGEITSPRCRYDVDKAKYYLEYSTAQGVFGGYTTDFVQLDGTEQIPAFTLEKAVIEEILCTDDEVQTVTEICILAGDEKDLTTGRQKKENFICQNVLEIPEETAEKLEKFLGAIRHVSVDPVVWEIAATQKAGERENMKENLPRAVCRYSDGSTHEKMVDWDEEILATIDFSKAGNYEVPGRIRQKHWPFPMMKEEISDPCITYDQGKYYLSATGMRDVSFRVSDTIDGCFKAKRTVVWSLPKGDRKHANIWAQELHIIHDVPYVFTTVASPEWYTVQSHVLRCTGDIADPKAWEEPRLCVKPDGTPVEEHGISLDMTYFCVDDIHYVMWSNRVIHVNEPDFMKKVDSEHVKIDKETDLELLKIEKEVDSNFVKTEKKKRNQIWENNLEKPEKAEASGTITSETSGKREKKGKKKDIVVCEPADIFIAAIDPDAPWQLTSNPVRVLRPQYGWDRLNTEVDEGPYLLRHGDDLFVTISGSSTGVADLYCLGLLHARAGSDLLRPESWDWLPYPVLTKESVPGEFGPGHNNFVKDAETGDDLMVYHAVPHDANGKSLGRHAGIRRVHWAANGYPYLEMTEERDLDPSLKDIKMKVIVRDSF